MTFEDFLPLLENVKGNADQYYAKCPAHEDKHESLSIRRGNDGKILLKCHAGCDVNEVAESLGLTLKDLFSQPLQNTKPAKRNNDRVREARYNYTDENGKLLNQKTRWRNADGSKNFSWSHISENGKWKSGKTKDIVLYNLPAIKSSDLIYIVEGEKDVETLRGYGIPAVCGEHGAGSDKWLPDYTEALKGKSIVVIQDNDENGKAFAIETCQKLSGAAVSVKLIDLTTMYPELPEKGDISDAVELYKENAIFGIKHLAETLPEYEQSESPVEEIIPEFFQGRKFCHNIMGDYLIKRFSVCKINGALHIYNDNIYQPGEDILHGYMVKLVPDITDARRKEVYKYIKVSLCTPVKELSPPNLIPFATKIYDLNTDSFLEYSPKYVFLNRFPYDYKPDAPEEISIVETIRQIANHDNDVFELILEAIGNCFYLLNSFRGAAMLYGSGRNGKSTLLNMIIQLLGKVNTSHLSMQDLAERFRLVDVYGKAANIGDDIPSTYLPDSSNFKKMVTGEQVIGEKKGQDPFSFKPFAKMFFAMNGLPAVSDKSKGYFSRILLIPLNQDFAKLSPNPALKDKQWSQQEMEYLTRLSMEALKRLLKQGEFIRPEVVKKAIAEYEMDNNPVMQFLEEFGNVENKIIQEVYRDYTVWCGECGHRNAFSKIKFTQEVINITGLCSQSKWCGVPYKKSIRYFCPKA